MKKNIVLIIILSICFSIQANATTQIQLVWMKFPYSFQEELQKSLQNVNYKIVKQNNIPKDFIEGNMLRLELHVFLSGSSLYRQTEFGDMGNKTHNPFEIELNINVSGKSIKGLKVDEHLILSHSDFTGKKTINELYEEIIKDLLSEIARIQTANKIELDSTVEVK
jgi:hypothetical protein